MKNNMNQPKKGIFSENRKDLSVNAFYWQQKYLNHNNSRSKKVYNFELPVNSKNMLHPVFVCDASSANKDENKFTKFDFDAYIISIKRQMASN